MGCRKPRHRDAYGQGARRSDPLLKGQQGVQHEGLGQVSKNQRSRIARKLLRDLPQDFISIPYPITQGLQPTYEYVAAQRPEIWNQKPEAFMDSSFIAELEKTGFIKNLSR